MLFFNYFFFLKPHEKAGPVPGTISIDQPANRQEAEIPSASDSPVSEEQHGLDAVRDLAVSLAAQDYPSLYAITNVGLSEHGEEPCYWAQCTGQDSGGETLVMNYFLTLDGTHRSPTCLVLSMLRRGMLCLTFRNALTGA